MSSYGVRVAGDTERVKLAPPVLFLMRVRAKRLGASLVAGVMSAVGGALAMAAVLAITTWAVAADSALMWHLVACIDWGLFYGLVALPLGVDRSTRGALLLGVSVGLASQLLEPATAVPRLADWVGHLVFGVGFAGYPRWLALLTRARVRWDDPRIRD
jgi:hypothetical protein